MPRYFEIVRDDGFVEVMTVSDIPDPKPIAEPVYQEPDTSHINAKTLLEAGIVPSPELIADVIATEKQEAERIHGEKVAEVRRRNAEALAEVAGRRAGAPGYHLARWRATGKTDVSFREIAKADVPTDRYFRDAWSAGLTVDMAKARDIHMAQIRKARDAALPALDIEFSKAQGKRDNAKADAVEAQRQALRDLPATFDLTGAKTPAELKALWPGGLERGR